MTYIPGMIKRKPMADMIEGIRVATRVGHYCPASCMDGYKAITEGTPQLDKACEDYLVARGFVVLRAGVVPR